MKVFVPFRTYSSPSSTAVVRMAATSDPALAAVRQKAANPLFSVFSTKWRACSSVPFRRMLRKATKFVTKVSA